MIVTCIHNNSLGQVFACDDEDEGAEIIRKLVKSRLNRDLTEEEEEILENNLEFSDESDPDNLICFAIGEVSEFQTNDEGEEETFERSQTLG